jgi:hypothetical protein
VQAASPPDFTRQYGLLVHQRNEDKPIPKLRGLQVLLKYFPDRIDLDIDFEDPKDACRIDFVNCEKYFYPYQGLSMREMLLWLAHLEDPGIENESDDAVYLHIWRRARQNNWLPKGELSYSNFQELLYRYHVTRVYGIPYEEGLVTDIQDISPALYSDLMDVRRIKQSFFQKQFELKTAESLSDNEQELLDVYSEHYQAYIDLQKQVKALNHPLNVLPDLPEEIRVRIIDNDLNQILSTVSYDYSGNVPNRKHNLVTGLQQMNGKVFKPGETMDFTRILGENGWHIYKYGWVIFGGIEAWQFGGGLCGSATMVFTPSWNAGLEVVQRHPHSAYYINLYPGESLGLDATIYRGAKNLMMKNTLDSAVLYYVADDPEKEVISVYLIGNSPYVSVDIEGPIEMTRTHYKWIRRMTLPNGKVVTDELETRYNIVY